ncbi:MAG: CoA-binding protein [Ignavibacteriales bacterium]|jgi:predicted CoA-binding protein|nr:CoA-binding protein [Ignavibacteriales bacterium]MBK7267826.1 CoA-binding protein [Ignavibacteriales bacterium]
MDKQIEKMVSEKTFALVGVSSDVKKFGNAILKELTARGFTIYPVHPSLQMVEGVKCYKTLDLVAGLTSNLIICVKPERAALLVKEAASLGFTSVWLQQGSGSKEATENGVAAGIHVVSGKCILMYTEPVAGMHKFHRGINKLFGKY